MIVQCIDNTGARLPKQCLSRAGGYHKDSQFWLTVGKSYTVYGLTVMRSYPWYYIADETFIDFPIYRPAPLFEVVDSQLSRYWEYGYYPNPPHEPTIVLAYPEWVRDEYHYERLTDGVQEDVRVFLKYKELMDSEFA